MGTISDPDGEDRQLLEDAGPLKVQIVGSL